MPTFQEFTSAYKENLKLNPRWRKGQTAFNTMSDLCPDLAEKIRATVIDPFYLRDQDTEENLAPFWNWLEGELNVERE